VAKGERSLISRPVSLDSSTCTPTKATSPSRRITNGAVTSPGGLKA
jgi:hypothetical protein